MRQSPSRTSSVVGSRPCTRELQDSSRAMTPAELSKRTFRMRVNVASLSPAHFEHTVCRFSPFDDYSSSNFLPAIHRSDQSAAATGFGDTFCSSVNPAVSPSRAAMPSRPHTVIASLAEDLGPTEAPVDEGPAAVAVLRDPQDGESALTALLAERGGTVPSRSRRHRASVKTAAAGGFEFPSLTRVDLLRRRRGQSSTPSPSIAKGGYGVQEVSTTPGIQLMATRIAPPVVRAASVAL